jgi:xanthine dehydrogenase/oxidase
LISSFFFKFFLHTTYKLEAHMNFKHELPESYRSAVAPYEREPSRGIQVFQTLPNATAVGLPFQHQSANLQVTGEAEYVDDVAMPAHGLHAALVLSTKPHAKLVSVDASEAENQPGFAGFFSAKDIPGANDIGAIRHDEEVFATEEVTCVGQVIGVVVADTHENAKDAARKVKIVYEDLPAILDLDQAVAANMFLEDRTLEMGDVDTFFANAKVNEDILVAEGEVRMGGQEHFYLEPNSTLIWTTDAGNEVHMVSSTQAPQKHQRYVSHVLGIPQNKVVCKLKRIGGGFGGKETRSAFITAAACVPSYLLQRPVRITLDRDMDMAITGQRHAFMAKYKVGFTKEGKILALEIDIFNNAGNSLDLSGSVLERAMFHSDNVYRIPNMRVRGRCCFSNLSSNTAFRGFGGPQGMLVVENWIDRIASEVGRRPEEIREINFQEDGQELHYGQLLEVSRHHGVWNELKKKCEFEKRLAEVEAFNKQHRWKKRGVAMIPTKFGISFTTKFLNQAGALVQVYTDGTVLVSHGGVEMGQGLHTKMAQIAATEFNIALKDVFISETATDKVPNSSPTAASASADMYGGAVLDACKQIKKRIDPIAANGNYATFADLVTACYLQRIDLSAHGFYITPDIGMDWDTGKGMPFNYFTFGAAFALAEIDTLTGDFHLPRVDIVMDLGYSLNPAIDIGQVEGGYVQGLGWVILEELKWGDPAHPWVRPGHLFTQGPGTYKIPTVNDIPIDFRVSLLKDAPNTRAVHSSKAVGEPPLFLAASAFFAIKDAIAAARKDAGHPGYFVLDTPATPERIRMACADEFTKPFAKPDIRPKLSV